MMDKTWDQEFRERLAHHYDELKWLYFELYHQDEHAFGYFCEMLYKNYKERPEYLKKLDRERLENPNWYRERDMLGMQMYVNAFAGNLKGVKKHLDYIRECGVNYLHLMPLLESPEGRSDGGYAVSDFRKVQPELGTMEDLAALTRDCHESGMSVCLDFVMNHTSEDHEWARMAREGDEECRRKYFFFDSWDIPVQYERTVPQVFPTTAPGNFSWCGEAGKVVMTTFYPYQWDLNYANPTVFNDMTSNMLFLCNQGIDIIRLDAVPYIWKTIGTNCRNLPQVHSLVRMMRMASEVVCPATLLLGEVVMEPVKVAPYFGSVEKPECHMLYNVTTMASTWNTVATKDVRLLRHQLEAVFALPREYMFLNYLRCHDDIGWGLDYDYLKRFGLDQIPHKKYLNDYLTGKWYGSDSRGELYNDDPRIGDARLCGTTASLAGIEAAEYERNKEKQKRAVTLDIMLHAFLMAQSGLPILYSGDEIGQLNDYAYHDDPLKADDSRYLHRGNLKWEEVKLRTDESTRQGRIFQSLRRLETIRRDNPVFDANADTWVLEPYNDHILALGRYYEGEKLIALFNFSEYDETAWINEVEDYVDLMTGKSRPARAVGIPAYDFAYLLTSFNKKEKKKEAKKPASAAKARKKLIFLDIDGTLTEPGENVPPESALEAIRKAQKNGHKVFLCTGRNYAMLKPLLKYGFDGMVAGAGGYVTVGDEVIFDCPMTDRQTRTALDVLHKNGVFCTLEAKDATFGDDNMEEFLAGQEEGNSEIERWRKALSEALDIRPMGEYDGVPAYKIVIMCLKEEQLKEPKKLLSGDFDFRIQEVAEHSCLNGELINRKYDKGRGIIRICEHLGMSLKDTVGFGDSMNDLEMIETVGVSVCMENGSKALKEKSDIVCPAVGDDGLAKAFADLGLV